MYEALNQADICFVVDTTGSMGPFIEAAKRHLIDAMNRLRADSSVDMRFGLVEYRDHPPQDTTFVTRIHPLSSTPKEMQKVIDRLKADGGGDTPEAVYDGVYEACTKIAWRPHSSRFVLLVGDAPPHGYRAHERTASGETETGPSRRRDGGDLCPCGLTVHSVTAAAEARRVIVHALCMGHYYSETVEAFTAIARGTGGQCVPADSAVQVVEKMAGMLAADFADLPFDRQVLETFQRLEDPGVQAIAESLDCPRGRAAAALARLGRRGFLEPAPA